MHSKSNFSARQSYSKFYIYHPPFISSFRLTSKWNTMNPLQNTIFTELKYQFTSTRERDLTEQNKKRDKIKEKETKERKQNKIKTETGRPSSAGQTSISFPPWRFHLAAGLVAWQTMPNSGKCNRSALASLVI